jgi:N-acetylneuraminic acid mutarotase
MQKTATALTLIMALLFSAVAGVLGTSTAPEENSWTTKTPMPDGITIVRAAAVNGKIYVMTGSLNYEYDTATDNWTAKKPIPTTRLPASFAIAACQDKIYVIGGNSGPSGYTNYLSTNEVYDPSTDSWETKEPMPTAREWMDANVVDGKIYVIGGVADSFSSMLTPVNEVYDPATDSWTTLQPAPIAIDSYASAVLNNKIYVMGGLSHNDTYGWQANQIYNAENDVWSLGATLPNATRFAAAGATTGMLAPKKIYVIGGGLTKASNAVNVYDPAFDNWTSGAPIPTGRIAPAATVVNDVLYVFGGAVSYQGTFPVGAYLEAGIVEAYTPFGYGIVPSIVSPETNKTYVESEVPLTFTLLKLASWLGYSLDGQDNVTVTGNTTLTGLANGFHNVTVYVKDPLQNEVASETMYFTVETPFLTVLVIAVVGVSAVAIIGIGLLVYFRKRKR